MRMALTKISVDKTDPIKIPNTKRLSFRTHNYLLGFGLPSMDCFVENFFLTIYWNMKHPLDSVVEHRYRERYDDWKESKPIDPKLLKTILSDKPRYRDAIVELAPGRSFFKGLCGDWVVQLDRYDERTSDSLAGSLLFDNGNHLAIALSFPGKIKSMLEAKKVHDMISNVDEFVNEMKGAGTISSQIRELKMLISQKKRQIEEVDIYNSQDHETFEKASEFLREYGIEYDLTCDILMW